MGGNSSTEPPRSNINVVIKASKNSYDASVIAQGDIISPITELDFENFKFVPEIMYGTVIELHKSKSELIRNTHSLVSLYVKGPIPFKDKYATNEWREVKKIVRPLKADIIDVFSEPVMVANNKFTNRSTKTVSYNASLTHEEQNTVTSTWSTTSELDIGLEIDYKVIMPGSGVISFKSAWGENTEQSKAITIGVQSGMTVNLSPGDEAVASLCVSRCLMKVRVTYEASMTGDIGCIFKDFWRWHYVEFDINDVLKAANLTTTMTYSEDITVRFSTDGEILLSDE